jgi:hypothetical protein
MEISVRMIVVAGLLMLALMVAIVSSVSADRRYWVPANTQNAAGGFTGAGNAG